MIENIERIGITNTFAVVSDPIRLGYSGPPLYPAIAIPVANKTDSTFECPPDHLGQLSELIPLVTKVLTIGWRGREEHFLGMLRNLGPISIAAIGGSLQEAEEPHGHIRRVGVPIVHFKPFAGFSDTIGEAEIDGFLAQ